MFADLCDLREFDCCWLKAGRLILDALHEQIDRSTIGTRFEWAELDQTFARNTEPFAAGGEQTKSRRLDTEQLHKGGGVLDHVLAIIEDKQRMAIGEVIGNLLHCVVAAQLDAAAASNRSAR